MREKRTACISVLYGENPARREDPEKFRNPIGNCGCFGKFRLEPDAAIWRYAAGDTLSSAVKMAVNAVNTAATRL